MLEPDEILDDLIAFFTPKVLAGRRVLVTAGPTYEAIDPVRGITNLSSGKMGFAMARAAREAGAGSRWWPVRSACPPRAACGASTCARRARCSTRRWPGGPWPRCSLPPRRWPTGDRPPPPNRRSRRTARARRPSCSSSRTRTFWPRWPDAAVGAAGALYCVGFAAESQDLLANAQAKRERKGVPLLVGNIGPATFGQDDNALLLVDADGRD
jgi:phosphopantothenoylcysteine decarboxylase/phosphopantothenate--cysteine ligase